MGQRYTKEFTALSTYWNAPHKIDSAAFVEQHHHVFATMGLGFVSSGLYHITRTSDDFLYGKVDLGKFGLDEKEKPTRLSIVRINNEEQVVMTTVSGDDDFRLWNMRCNVDGLVSVTEIDSSDIVKPVCKSQCSYTLAMVIASWENVLLIHQTGSDSFYFYRDLRYQRKIVMANLPEKIINISISSNVVYVADFDRHEVKGYSWQIDTFDVGQVVWGPLKSEYGTHVLTKTGNILIVHKESRSDVQSHLVLHPGKNSNHVIARIVDNRFQHNERLIEIITFGEKMFLFRYEGIYELQ